jgi:hypothetical protein
MLEIKTAIDIAAPPAAVWAVLADFSRHTEWNPTLVEMSGEAREGARVRVVIKMANGKRQVFKPVVTVFRPNEELRWRGALPIPGLFVGEHYFRLAPAAGGGTRVDHGEIFSGLLVPLMRRTLEADARQGFAAMNRALKARAEARA